ncbi:MICOS complex subunit MIC10 [Solea senegalensis]|uniref:MICOS complex subunit MIC10 n=1 Tax=Solea senegalensis TaxID=28829 RepID=A0AAV6QN30_SOLSE|nr:MICOS complex subunit MIC10 [Solea senegalensis]
MAEGHGRKWDRCFADTAVKTGRTWPVSMGSGLGLGMGYSNCQRDFKSPYLIHGRVVKDQ